MRTRFLRSNHVELSFTVILLSKRFKIEQSFRFQKHQIVLDTVWDVNSQYYRLTRRFIRNNVKASFIWVTCLTSYCIRNWSKRYKKSKNQFLRLSSNSVPTMFSIYVVVQWIWSKSQVIENNALDRMKFLGKTMKELWR